MTTPSEESTPAQRQQGERDRATAWISAHWTQDRRCPIDGAVAWTVTELIEVRPYHEGNLVLGGPIYPVFQVICNTCGYTMFFNGALTGVAQGAPDSETPKPENES